MIEEKLIAKILQSDFEFEIGLADDLIVSPIRDGFKIQRFKIGEAPSYISKEVSAEVFNDPKNAAEKFVNMRHAFKLGFDYELLKLKELDND